MTYSGVQKTSKKVVVGLTGRLASSVAAYLLKKQGYSVIGASIITNNSSDFKRKDLAPHCHIDDVEKIQSFCKAINIPFHSIEARNEFRDRVIDPLLGNKMSGIANISCYDCTRLRFDLLLDLMSDLKAEYISTGHFAKVQQNISSGSYSVHTTGDPSCGQSHLLAGLGKEILSRLILPLGDLGLKDVETIAKKFRLPIEQRKSFQEFCFDASDSFSEKAKRNIPKSLIKKGEVLNVETDTICGEHKGFMYYRATERNLSFEQASGPVDSKYEVVGFELKSNRILLGEKEQLSFKGFVLSNVELDRSMDKTSLFKCYFRTKSSNDFTACVASFKNNSSILLEFDEEFYPVILGDKVVLYERASRNARVVGVGTISDRGQIIVLDRAAEFRSREEREEYLPKRLRF